MSPLAIASTLYKVFQSTQSASSAQLTAGASAHIQTSPAGDFGSSLALRMASLQSQSVNTLIGSVFNTGNAASGASDPLSLLGLSATPGANAGLSASGRNLSLFDPESAYKMMTVINRKDLHYKAQFSELSEMKTALGGMQQAGQTLAGVNTAMDSETVKAELQAFAGRYNEWVTRFSPTVKSSGVLTGTQAAEISLYELEQSVKNIFNGARDGFHGVKDIGLAIDPTTRLATLDVGKLDSALSTNRAGVMNTIGEFSANFARSAELLNSTNNFVPNRLANLDRAIDYISEHASAWQAEFGRGDAAPSSAQIAKALAAYNRIGSV